MKIGIISDTHDHVPNIKRAVEKFLAEGVEEVIHAGDYCSPFTIPHFSKLKLTGVFGNNDGDHYRLMQKFSEIMGDLRGEFADLSYNGRRIAVYHGTQQGITDALVKCGTYDVVVTGHTHEPHITIKKNTIWINPGSAHGFDDFGTVAIYDSEANQAEILYLGN